MTNLLPSTQHSTSFAISPWGFPGLATVPRFRLGAMMGYSAAPMLVSS